MQLKRNNSLYDAPADVAMPRFFVLASTIMLVLLGIVMVYSASMVVNIDAGTPAYADALKQLAFAGVGFLLCILLRFLPYRLWQGPLTWLFFAGSIFLLVLTAAIGTESLGAQRWVNIGPVSMQPSEFAKIFIVLAVAKLVADYQDGQMSWPLFRNLFCGINLVLFGLILVAQSDFGTTLICIVGIVAILWLSEVRLRFLGVYLAVIGAGGVAALATASYRVQRLLSFTNPWDDYYGTGYQIIHSMYAFAQGGIFGAGLGNSAEKYLYLPEGSTDFIFAVIGEETGFVGAAAVIALFVFFLVGGLRMAQAAPDRFGAVVCGSFAVIIVFQAFLNIGCVIGLMPITGKPLPFVSAGGSSLIASLIMVGIMLSVSYASVESPVYGQRRAQIRPLPREERASGRVAAGTGRGAASVRRPVVAGLLAEPAGRGGHAGRGGYGARGASGGYRPVGYGGYGGYGSAAYGGSGAGASRRAGMAWDGASGASRSRGGWR